MSGKLLPAESEESNVPTGQRIYNMEQSGAGTNIGGHKVSVLFPVVKLGFKPELSKT